MISHSQSWALPRLGRRWCPRCPRETEMKSPLLSSRRQPSCVCLRVGPGFQPRAVRSCSRGPMIPLTPGPFPELPSSSFYTFLLPHDGAHQHAHILGGFPSKTDALTAPPPMKVLSPSLAAFCPARAVSPSSPRLPSSRALDLLKLTLLSLPDPQRCSAMTIAILPNRATNSQPSS